MIALYVLVHLLVRASRRKYQTALEEFIVNRRAAYESKWGHGKDGKKFLESIPLTWDQQSAAFGAYMSMSQGSLTPLLLGAVFDGIRAIRGALRDIDKPQEQLLDEEEITSAIKQYGHHLKDYGIYGIIAVFTIAFPLFTAFLVFKTGSPFMR